MIYLDDLLQTSPRTGAHLLGPAMSRAFDGFAFDSRQIRPGEIFVALRTARGDGHDYVEHAVQRGAAGVLVEREIGLSGKGATTVVVRDCRETLRVWADEVLARYAPLVVAVAGSVGKSTTQQAIVAVLAGGYLQAPVVFDNGDLNNLLGLPLALGRLEPSHQVAVLELAPDGFGEMAALARLSRPRVAVVTNALAGVVPGLASAEEAAAEVGALLEALPADGLAVLNADDPLLGSLARKTSAGIVTFGRRSPDADLRAERVESDAEGTSFDLCHADGVARVRLGLVGQHAVDAALAASAVGLAQGLTLDDVAAGLASLRPLPGRLRPLPGPRGATLLDDSLSASVPSTLAALDALAEMPARKRVVILGEVTDSRQGADRESARADLARRLKEVDALIAKGDDAEALGRLAVRAGLPADRLTVTHTAADAAASVETLDLQAGDVVLVKGGEASRLELAAERLLADPEQAPTALVRQQPGWRQRVFLSRERPTWVEIDLDGIGHNVERVKEIVGPDVEVMAVLKADAYGHGALRVARSALLHGASAIAMATLSEAVAMRERGITCPILILGYTPTWQAADIVRHGLAATVFSREVAEHLGQAAVAQHRAPTPVHVKVDSGMGRLGVLPADAVPFVEEIRRIPGLAVEGIFTHFATADSADKTYARRQLAAFRSVLDELAARGIGFRYVHAANSAAILSLPEAHFNMVRLGIAMHGLDPSPEVPCPPDFRAALVFKTQVAQVKSFPPGSCISYGCRFVTARPSRIAVLPVGYGDGFRRSPRHWGEVLVHGTRAPIVGTVCMDMSMIDVTDVPGDVRPGDEVILIGRQGREEITVEDVAKRLGTINYEVVTQILARVPREVSERGEELTPLT